MPRIPTGRSPPAHYKARDAMHLGLINLPVHHRRIMGIVRAFEGIASSLCQHMLVCLSVAPRISLGRQAIPTVIKCQNFMRYLRVMSFTLVVDELEKGICLSKSS